MLIEDIVKRPELFSTQRFMRDLRSASPSNQKAAKEFIEYKTRHGFMVPWGKKDTAFASNPELKSWWHAHLTFGREVLVYKPEHNRLLLACIIDHQDVDKSKANRLGRFISGLDQTDWLRFSLDRNDTKASTEEMKDMHDLIYELAGHHPDMLKGFVRGNRGPVIELLRMCITQPVADEAKDQMITTAFGGADGLLVLIRRVMQQMRVSESRRGGALSAEL